MGQIQSEFYECESDVGEDAMPRDSSLAALPTKKGASKRTGPTGTSRENKPRNGGRNQGEQKWHNMARAGDKRTTGSKFQKNLTATNDRMTLEQQQRHVRKLSNVSNRNIQLLSIKPRSEKETYAEGLRSRRRSSLINLILGAPSRGPRFSEDLCSLSSHMSELCNFGIDYFPDTIQSQASSNNGGHPGSLSSISSSLARLEEGFVSMRGGLGATKTSVTNSIVPPVGDLKVTGPYRDLTRRRRSSLGSLTSFEASQQVERPKFNLETDTSRHHNPFDAAGTNTASTTNADVVQATGVTVKNGERQAQQDAAQGGHELSKFSATGHPMSSSSISHHGHHQLGAHQQHQPKGAGAHKRAPSLSSMFLASVDLTSSLDGDATNDQQQLAGGALARGLDDNQSINAGRPEGAYYFNGHVGVGNKKTRPLMESWRVNGSSQDSVSLSSCSTNLATETGSAATTTTNELATTGTPVGQPVVAGDKGALLANRVALAAKGRINHAARRMIHRSGSELSLYSATAGSLSHNQLNHQHVYPRHISRGSIGSVMLEAGAARRDLAAADDGGGSSGGYSAGSLGDTPYYTLHQSPNDRTAKVAEAATAANSSHQRETKLIIMLQVCLPFILAGFGNMGAGLVLNQMAHWEAFRMMPIFFVLLPSFVGLKGNIEMTLASRLSTLSNLNLLDTSYQRRHAFLTNLILILSQAIGLSIFAAIASVACEFAMGKLDSMNVSDILNITSLVVLPAALVTSIVLVIVSSIVMWFAIWLARQLQVNPDNLSTLMAALYGDVSCVLTYGLFAQLMYSLNQQGVMIWPAIIIGLALISWPLLWYTAYHSRETHELALSSMPPMLTAIMVSLGSGAVLSLVVDRFSRVALYQPVVNGFGANLIAVQASRVSTWLWCTALRRLSAAHPASPSTVQTSGKVMTEFGFEFEPNNTMPYGSLASFVEVPGARKASVMSKQKEHKQAVSGSDGKAAVAGSLITKLGNLLKLLFRMIKLPLWSFWNSSPNSVAARLLLVMLVPAHSLYFIVIWLVAPAHYITLTWPFYMVYISLCVIQVFLLLMICQPLMTFLMHKHLDPDVFGISLLMALADLIGTLCLTGAFYLLASIGDPNAL